MQNFTEAYRLLDILYKSDKATPLNNDVDDFARWLIGEESDTYNELAGTEALKEQINEDIRAQDENQIDCVIAWLRGYLTARNVPMD